MSHRPRRSRRRQNQEAVELEVYDGMPDPLAPSTAVTADSFASTSQRRLDQDQVHDQGPPLPSLRSVLLERFGTRPPPNSHHSNDDELPPLQALRLSSSSSSREDGVAVAHPPLQVPSRRRSQSQSQSLPPQSDVTVHPPSRRFVPPVYSPLPRFNFRPTSPRSSGHVVGLSISLSSALKSSTGWCSPRAVHKMQDTRSYKICCKSAQLRPRQMGQWHRATTTTTTTTTRPIV